VAGKKKREMQWRVMALSCRAQSTGAEQVITIFRYCQRRAIV